MESSCLLLLATALCVNKAVPSTWAVHTYSGVVIEYSPPINSALDSKTNMGNNLMNYVKIIKSEAFSKTMADIVVFPETGLQGYTNKKEFVEVPDPADKVKPCARETGYDIPLVQLSCAARATGTYVVVNLAEKFYNASQQITHYYNTDVVFDSNGVVVARYRKINVWSPTFEPSPDGALSYFDTDFGVRFGLLTCFDIVFRDPGVTLARHYNVSHFVFPTAWFSELPFLTATQEQQFWSYTQDVVLLASGYNLPAVGSSGSGIYLGRRGPATYSMTQSQGTFMLQAYIPKNISTLDGSVNIRATRIPVDIQLENEPSTFIKFLGNRIETTNTLRLKRDELSVYNTFLITPLQIGSEYSKSSLGITLPYSIEKTICQNSLCCIFAIHFQVKLGQTKSNITRGDDYSQLYYRLAVFDGVKNYDGVATGGVQTCAVIPCVNRTLSSCALRSDSSSAVPNTLLGHYQQEFIFESVSITGNFTTNNSFVGPNVLLRGEDNEYGSLLPPENFTFTETAGVNDTVVKSLQTRAPITSLVTVSIYGRVFTRDGDQYTGYTAPTTSFSAKTIYSNTFTFLISIVVVNMYF